MLCIPLVAKNSTTIEWFPSLLGLSQIVLHKPDIVVVPECEHPDKLKFESGTPIPNDAFWFGKNQHKGLGVFSYSDFKFELNNTHRQEFRTILPLTATNKKKEIQFICHLGK